MCTHSGDLKTWKYVGHRPLKIAHPELRKGELFLGNMCKEEFCRTKWKSKRCGKVAYDNEETVIECLFPVFILKEENDVGRKVFQKYQRK